MTNVEAAELRGEIFGLKILLFNCLSSAAATRANPDDYLDEVEQHAVFGIAQAHHSAVQPGHTQRFRDAAAGIIAQAIEAVREAHLRGAQPPTRQ